MYRIYDHSVASMDNFIRIWIAFYLINEVLLNLLRRYFIKLFNIMLITVPAASVLNFKKFKLRLLSKDLHLWIYTETSINFLILLLTLLFAFFLIEKYLTLNLTYYRNKNCIFLLF